jgi:2-dehydropantoate 2-reductase
MRILIFGTGGIGGYFGARLQASGETVVFAARGAFAEALRDNGLQVHSQQGDLHLSEMELYDPEQTKPVDVVLICTKMGALAEAIEAVRPVLHEDTAVIPLQNGVESVDLLAAALPADNVLGGVAYISAHIEEPGVIRHNTEHARIVFGELSGEATGRALDLRNRLERAGLGVVLSDDIRRALWEKFVTLAPLAGACSFYRKDIGGVRAEAEGRRLLQDLAGECIAVGRAQSIALPDDVEEKTVARFDELGGAVKPSMLVDLERGKPLELEWLTGATVRLGAAAGVPTPASSRVYEALKPYAEGAPA